MDRETLFLTKNPFTDIWYLKDSSGHNLGGFETVDKAKEFAKEMNYKLQIKEGDKKIEWFNS